MSRTNFAVDYGMYMSQVERPPHAVFYYYWGAFRFLDSQTFHPEWFYAMRLRGADLVRRYLKVRSSVRRMVDVHWGRLVANGHDPSVPPFVVGLHMRGADVTKDTASGFSVRRRLHAADYLPYARALLTSYPQARFLLVTDDDDFLREVVTSWPADVRSRLVNNSRPSLHRPKQGFFSYCMKHEGTCLG